MGSYPIVIVGFLGALDLGFDDSQKTLVRFGLLGDCRETTIPSPPKFLVQGPAAAAAAVLEEKR